MSKIVLRVLSISITVLISVLIVCGLYRVGLMCYDFGYRIYTEPAVSAGDTSKVRVQVTEDMDAMELAQLLENKELVRDHRLFFVQEKLRSFQPQAGEYQLSRSMTPQELMEALTPQEEQEGEPSS